MWNIGKIRYWILLVTLSTIVSLLSGKSANHLKNIPVWHLNIWIIWGKKGLWPNSTLIALAPFVSWSIRVNHFMKICSKLMIASRSLKKLRRNTMPLSSKHRTWLLQSKPTSVWRAKLKLKIIYFCSWSPKRIKPILLPTTNLYSINKLTAKMSQNYWKVPNMKI